MFPLLLNSLSLCFFLFLFLFQYHCFVSLYIGCFDLMPDIVYRNHRDLGGCFLGLERNCIYLQEAAVCISSLIQTGIETIQSWASVTEVNLSPLTPRLKLQEWFSQTKCSGVQSFQLLTSPKYPRPSICTVYQQLCQLLILLASFFWKKKKKDTWGKGVTNAGSPFCTLFLSQILVLKFSTALLPALLTLQGLQIFVLLSSFLAILRRRVGFSFLCVIDCMQK